MDIQTEKCSQYPLISVIIPVYKVENYIRSCVDSILNQKLTNFECILVDDGSPDNCPTICDEYAQNDRRIRVVHQENQGLSAARNAGMRMASGEWLAFVDSDDCVHPDYLSMLYETAQATDADIVCCSFFSIQDQESMDEKWTYSPLKKSLICSGIDALLLHYKKGNFSFNVWDKLYKRDILINQLFPVSLYHEDQYFNTHVMYNCKKIACIDNKLYAYRIRNSSITGSPFTARALDRITVKYDAFLFFKEKGHHDLLENSAHQFWRSLWKYLRKAVKHNCLSDTRDKEIRVYCENIWNDGFPPGNPFRRLVLCLYRNDSTRKLFFTLCKFL